MKAFAHPPADPTALDELTGQFLDSYQGDERARRISHRYLPSREAIVEILEAVLDLIPGLLRPSGLERRQLGWACRANGVGAGAEARARDGALSVLRP